MASDPEEGIAVEMSDLFSLDHDVDGLTIDVKGREWAILTHFRYSRLVPW